MTISRDPLIRDLAIKISSSDKGVKATSCIHIAIDAEMNSLYFFLTNTPLPLVLIRLFKGVSRLNYRSDTAVFQSDTDPIGHRFDRI